MRLIDIKGKFPNEAACKTEFKLERYQSAIICKKNKKKFPLSIGLQENASVQK